MKNEDNKNPHSAKINWFPGHMAKTRRLITENLKFIDIALELRDARIPAASRNDDMGAVVSGKPVLILLNKASLADEDTTRRWIEYYKNCGISAMKIDCITGEGISAIGAEVRRILADKIKKYEDKGMSGKQLRALIMGIPNVGKSSLVNRLCLQKKAKVEDRPGVTLRLQWAATNAGFDLLDVPGVLPPRLGSRTASENLAFTGAVKDAILDTEELGMTLASRLLSVAPEKLCARYNLDYDAVRELDGYDLVCEIGRKRGNLMAGGNINTERTALMLIDEFRSAKIGRISLEAPPSGGAANA